MTIIDFHAHLAPRIPSEFLTELDSITASGGAYVVDGTLIGPPALYNVDALIAAMKTAGVDHAVVSPPPPFYRQGRADAGWVRAVNDGVLDAIAGRAELSALAYLPLEKPQLAVAEYDRVSSDPRWTGFTASAGGGSLSLASTELEPLWHRLDAGAHLLFLHPGHPHDPRLDEFYLHNLLGNPTETGVAVAQLVFAGVPSNFPKIRFLLAHGGGVVPAVAARWDRGLETARPGINTSIEAPTTAVRRFWTDSLTHDPGALERAAEVFGRDKIVLGSDWPFPMGVKALADLVVFQRDCFDPENAVALLGEGGQAT